MCQRATFCIPREQGFPFHPAIIFGLPLEWMPRRSWSNVGPIAIGPGSLRHRSGIVPGEDLVRNFRAVAKINAPIDAERE